MKDKCFTILCWFLPNINMNQPEVYLCHLSLDPSSPLPPRPSPLGCHRAWFEFPPSHSKFPLAIYFTYGNVYISMLLSPYLLPFPSLPPFYPPPPPTAAFISLFSVSVSLEEIRPFLQMLQGSRLASSPPVGLLHAQIIAPSA